MYCECCGQSSAINSLDKDLFKKIQYLYNIKYLNIKCLNIYFNNKRQKSGREPHFCQNLLL